MGGWLAGWVGREGVGGGSGVGCGLDGLVEGQGAGGSLEPKVERRWVGSPSFLQVAARHLLYEHYQGEEKAAYCTTI